MSGQEKAPGKSRRRFLADMLFLGGGITAAALLAKTVGNESQPSKPATSPSPKELAQPVEHPVPQGEMMIPEGDMVMPEPPGKEPVTSTKKSDCQEPTEPVIEGRVAPPAPQQVPPLNPNKIPPPRPDGGMVLQRRD